MDLNNLGYTDEPFVLANDVAQVFYVKDMSTKPRKRKDKEVNTSRLSAVGWKHVLEVTTMFVMSCTCCPGGHL